jgi:hypothetical protein
MTERTEETVYNVEQGPRQCTIFCNWCLETNSYTEKEGEYHEFVSCAWCRKRLKVPRAKLARINGNRPGVSLR